MSKRLWRHSLGFLLLPVLAGFGAAGTPAADSDQLARAGADQVEINTPHYLIVSTVEEDAARRAGVAVEALFDAYAAFFADASLPVAPSMLRVRLYGDRPEFLAASRSRPWAEAYYSRGVCHAYMDPDKPNPYHWLVHEAVHQLNREWTGFATDRWINEGLASYFGASRYAAGRLEPGVPDVEAYPARWLRRWELTGDWPTDVSNRRVIPLRTLIEGKAGPEMDAAVNAYYLGWWSLTHFLLHGAEGRHADAYRTMARSGGSVAEFERRVGPLEKIEQQWYAHLAGLVAAEAKMSE